MIKPRAPIRRFDVFAEYTRLKGLKQGLDEPHARGYGLWVAKVVASGGGRRATAEPHVERPSEGAPEHRLEAREQEWHTLSGEPQTDALFEREIVRRMGEDFYRRTFAPAIAAAFEQGKSYPSIRDSVRKDWKP
jgi:hypothetical protein